MTVVIMAEAQVDRQHFMRRFSERLTELMQQAGFGSQRSQMGVKIAKLAEVSCCSQQMARRYTLGEALPSIEVIDAIAKWLQVAPGWLLFGDPEEGLATIDCHHTMRILPELLEYILLKSAPLFYITKDIPELVHFIMDIINDITHIDADEKSILKIVDMSINSAARFHVDNKDANDQKKRK